MGLPRKVHLTRCKVGSIFRRLPSGNVARQVRPMVQMRLLRASICPSGLPQELIDAGMHRIQVRFALEPGHNRPTAIDQVSDG